MGPPSLRHVRRRNRPLADREAIAAEEEYLRHAVAELEGTRIAGEGRQLDARPVV